MRGAIPQLREDGVRAGAVVLVRAKPARFGRVEERSVAHDDVRQAVAVEVADGRRRVDVRGSVPTRMPALVVPFVVTTQSCPPKLPNTTDFPGVSSRSAITGFPCVAPMPVGPFQGPSQGNSLCGPGGDTGLTPGRAHRDCGPRVPQTKSGEDDEREPTVIRRLHSFPGQGPTSGGSSTSRSTGHAAATGSDGSHGVFFLPSFSPARRTIGEAAGGPARRPRRSDRRRKGNAERQDRRGHRRAPAGRRPASGPHRRARRTAGTALLNA